MSDSVALAVAGRKIERFLSYRIDADLYCSDDAFRMEAADPGVDIDPGMACGLIVNNRTELTGIIDRVEDGDDKNGSDIAVEGRDLMGLLTDSYVAAFPDLEDITIKGLADVLLKDVPFINRKAIVYQSGIAGASASDVSGGATGAMAGFGVSARNVHVEPGKTIFEVLRYYAACRGAMFYALPDGTFVFGRPKAQGRPAFSIIHRRDGKGNMAVRIRRTRDISRRWSKITVLCQQQGADSLSADDINSQSTVTDPDMPFYKPYVAVVNNDDYTPAQKARMLLEQQRADGFRLVYTIPGHSQNGRNWAINELCHVIDEKRRINGIYLIYGRTFILAKPGGSYGDGGKFTEVRLGLPGVVQ